MWPFTPSATKAEPPMCQRMEDTMTFPESSLFTMQGDDLIIQMRGKLFPKQGGAECGSTSMQFNLSQHFRDLIAEALAKTR